MIKKRMIFSYKSLILMDFIRNQYHDRIRKHRMVSTADHGVTQDHTIKNAMKKHCLTVLIIARQCQIE